MTLNLPAPHECDCLEFSECCKHGQHARDRQIAKALREWEHNAGWQDLDPMQGIATFLANEIDPEVTP